jgi:hypothetical protein
VVHAENVFNALGAGFIFELGQQRGRIKQMLNFDSQLAGRQAAVAAQESLGQGGHTLHFVASAGRGPPLPATGRRFAKA